MADVGRVLTIRGFKDLHKFLSYYEKEVSRIGGTYVGMLNSVEEMAEGRINSFNRIVERLETTSNPRERAQLTEQKIDKEKWYGEPYPRSIDEIKTRNVYANMEKYSRITEDLQPYMEGLMKNSSINAPVPKLMPNSKELGSFSFERAMMSPKPIAGYYSEKHKQFFPIKDCYMKEEKGKKNLFLKSDDSPIVIRQLEENGKKKMGSTNKSVFLYKQPVVKPLRAIELFVDISVNCDKPAFWAGIVGMAVAKHLEAKGYSVGVTMVIGSMVQNAKHNGDFVGQKTRYSLIKLKEVGGGYDTATLLYALADGSFFRYKVFRAICADYFKYGDERDDGLGSAVSVNVMEEDISLAIKKRDWEITQNAIPFFIGGNDLTNEEQAKTQIERIITTCEARNMIVKIAITGDGVGALIEAYNEAKVFYDADNTKDTFLFCNERIGIQMAKYMIAHLEKIKNG